MKIGFTYIAVITSIITILLCTSCQDKEGFGCFKSTGDIITEERYTSFFDTIELQNNVNLFLTYDTLQTSIIVEAGENLIDKISCISEANKLVIKNDNSCNWTRDYSIPVNVHIRMPDLSGLIYRGSGDIHCQNSFVIDSIQVDIREGAGSIALDLTTLSTEIFVHEGTADVTVMGSTWIIYLSNNGFGPVDCLGLESQFVFMRNSSPNHCYIYAGKSLNVEISNIGDVFYTGNPEKINTSISSSGRLIKMD